MQTIKIKSNSAWDSLCAITSELFAKFGSRPAAFKAACAQHPDLAAAAVDPTGRPVKSGLKAPANSGTNAAPKKSYSETFGRALPWTEVNRKIEAQERPAR